MMRWWRSRREKRAYRKRVEALGEACEACVRYVRDAAELGFLREPGVAYGFVRAITRIAAEARALDDVEDVDWLDDLSDEIKQVRRAIRLAIRIRARGKDEQT